MQAERTGHDHGQDCPIHRLARRRQTYRDDVGSKTEQLTLAEVTDLVDAASDVTFTGSIDGRVTWVSSGVVDLLDWSPNDVIGEPFIDLVHPDDRPKIVQARAEADAEQPLRSRVRIRDKQGVYRWVDILLRTRFDDAGNEVGRFGSWRDAGDDVAMQEALAHEAERVHAILDGMLDPWVLLAPVRDHQGRIDGFTLVDANPVAATYYGRDLRSLIGTALHELIAPEELRRVTDMYRDVVETGVQLVAEALPAISPVTGEAHLFDLRAGRVGDCLSVTWRDVTERVRAQEALVASEERYRLLSTNASELIVLARDYRVVWASPSALAFFGAGIDTAFDLDLRSLLLPDDLPAFEDAYTAADAGESRVVRLRAFDAQARMHWVEVHAGPYTNADGEHHGVLTSTRVIDDLITIEQELEHRARFDLLTGLMNRSEALRSVSRLAAHHPRTGARTAMLFCDIDRFKSINDTHGHAAGDTVLRMLGGRLGDAIRSDDFAARIGGDELLVVLAGVHSLEEAVELAEKIRLAATEPIALDSGVAIEPGLSIGVTLVEPGESTDSLIERADNAMYRAKSTGRNRVIAIGASNAVEAAIS